jgi:pantoate--beta-alanine ligase
MRMRTMRGMAEVRGICSDARRAGQTVGLVPTMGAFHAGHRSLMRAARGECDLIVVSLFVNPTQFGPNEDLAGYPRDEKSDAFIAATEGVDVLFAPAVGEMYPEASRTSVHVAGLTDRLCGASRPGHFDGVTTVVTKLLSIVGPCRAYFGRKDAQQLAVLRRMVRDLDIPVEVVGCPLVREPDGVAMSSRNAYLTDEERSAATVLSRALRATAAQAAAGQSAESVRALVREYVDAEALVELEYVEVVDASMLEPIDELSGEVLVALAARVGRARLIDNCTITVLDDGSTISDLGVLS